ncbi:efflux RND transporter periplasmic adaptor subunit [Endozoicomonas lisbonensis]|uniref:RND family efflux transporter MFP subunit n=1 Tax=Endozoicomonas lisbonensis TaxID=3120522 RepID=A0ABV2SN04_9GAMM
MIRKSNFSLPFVFLATVWLPGCDQTVFEPQETLRPVRFMTVSYSETGLQKKFPGVVEAAQQANLSFRVSGRLASLNVKEGSAVVGGQVVAELESVEFDIRLKDRQATYDAAKADYERAVQLIGKGAIARADVDNLKAKLSTATAQLETARHEKAHTRLRAPFNGQIAKVYVDNYEEVSAKQDVVALHDLSSLLIKVEMPESVIVNAQEERQPLRYSARFDGLGDKVFPLQLSAFAALADDSSQTYTVTFMLSDRLGSRILPGMSASVMIKQMVPAGDWLVIPAHSVQEDNDGRFVYVVEAAEAGVGVVFRRPVQTGRLLASGIEVTSGLVAGERLVTAGMSQMAEGMRVKWMEGGQ